MWTMTIDGFFSAVQHRDEPDLLVVRTRVRADADFLRAWYADWAKAVPTEDYPQAVVLSYEASDYPWRVILPKQAWAQYLFDAAQAIDYGNFKDAVKVAQGPDRARRYASVWAALLGLEDDDPDGRPRPDWDDETWPGDPYAALEADMHSTWGNP